MVEEEIPTYLLQNGKTNYIQGLKFKIQNFGLDKRKNKYAESKVTPFHKYAVAFRFESSIF